MRTPRHTRLLCLACCIVSVALPLTSLAQTPDQVIGQRLLGEGDLGAEVTVSGDDVRVQYEERPFLPREYRFLDWLAIMETVLEEVPQVARVKIGVTSKGVPVVEAVVDGDKLREIRDGRLDADGFLQSLVVTDLRSPTAIVEDALLAFDIYDSEATTDGAEFRVSFLQPEVESPAELAALWSGVFVSVAENASNEERIVLEAHLPYVGEPVLAEVAMADARAYLAGQLSEAEFLDRWIIGEVESPAEQPERVGPELGKWGPPEPADTRDVELGEWPTPEITALPQPATPERLAPKATLQQMGPPEGDPLGLTLPTPTRSGAPEPVPPTPTRQQEGPPGDDLSGMSAPTPTAPGTSGLLAPTPTVQQVGPPGDDLSGLSAPTPTRATDLIPIPTFPPVGATSVPGPAQPVPVLPIPTLPPM